MLSPSGVYLRKNAKQKYDAILKAAYQLFLKNGYTGTSMDAVAQAADVSKQTVYSYFTNKDVLFCQMIEAQCARHTPPETFLDNPKLKPEDALFRIGRGFLDLISSPRGLAICRLVMSEAEHHPRIAKLFYETGPLQRHAMLARYLSKPEINNVFAIDDMDAAVMNFFALVKSRHYLRLQLRIKPLPTKQEFDSHVRDSVKIFCQIYGK